MLATVYELYMLMCSLLKLACICCGTVARFRGTKRGGPGQMG